MNIIKTTLIVTLLALLAACGGEDNAARNSGKTFSINGAFGIKLNTVDKNLPEGYVSENMAIVFTPDIEDKRFVKYEYSTTPKSHVIYGITVKSPRELAKASCLEQRDQLIEKTLNTLGTSPQFKVSKGESKWKIREHNQRQITIECEQSVSPQNLQLVMVYQDTSLSVMAFKEWKKRQDEIMLIRF
ncbi:MAG: hypothetical protein A6F72_00515 [Cycloclasticus sp. symbiont of Poecilosclerida sp. N]|nr:MAG: hypothetical protein A6F72_00515 [Cycloclasticus sp. symbiont of Poecilosclerida sp. N]